MAIIAISEGEKTTLFPEPAGLWVACRRKERPSRRILRSCAAFHCVFATISIVTQFEFGKIHGGIRRSTCPSADELPDSSTLPRLSPKGATYQSPGQRPGTTKHFWPWAL